jgi:hypothetical protein
MAGRELVLFQRAEVGHAGRLGRVPTLAVVDPPGMDHDHGRAVGPQAIGHLDDPAGVVREPPGPHSEIGPLLINERRRLKSPQLPHRLDELGIIGQQRLRVSQRNQPVVIRPRGGLFAYGRWCPTERENNGQRADEN